MAARAPTGGQEREAPVQWETPLDAFDDSTDRDLVRHRRSQVEELQASPPASLVDHLSDLEKETFNYHDEDTKRREAAVEAFVPRLLTKLKVKDPILHDATVEKIGSHWGGTRVSKKANEFDFLICLPRGDVKVHSPCKGSIDVNEIDGPWKRGQRLKGHFLWADGFTRQLCHDIDEVMPTLILPEGLTHVSLMGNKYRGVTRNEPACTVSLLWEDRDLVTVDVSVGILPSDDKLTDNERGQIERLCDIAGLTRLKDIYFIPGKNKWLPTASLIEKEILQNLDPQSRMIKCIRMFKLFCRRYLHWGPTEQMVRVAHSIVDSLGRVHEEGIVEKASVEEGGVGERGVEAEGAVGGAEVRGAVAVAGMGRGSVVHGGADVADVKDWGNTLGVELGHLEPLIQKSLSAGAVQELPDKGDPTYQSRLALVLGAISSRHLGQSHYHADCTLCTSLKEFSMVEQEEYLHPALAEVLNESVKPWISVHSVYCKYLALQLLMVSDESDPPYWKGSEKNAEKEERVLGEWIDRLLSDIPVSTDRGVEHPIFGDIIRPLSYRVWGEKREKKAWEISPSTFHECVLMLNKIREILVNQTTKHEK